MMKSVVGLLLAVGLCGSAVLTQRAPQGGAAAPVSIPPATAPVAEDGEVHIYATSDEAHSYYDRVRHIARPPADKPPPTAPDTTNPRFKEQWTKKPSRMACDRIDFNYDTRQAVVSGSIRMNQEDNYGTCQQIIFDERRNIADLRGEVEF